MQKVILVTEDDPGLNALICRQIVKSGWEAIPALSGSEALKNLRKDSVDLLLLDYQMPDMNGAEVAEKMRKDKTAIPFIVITGHGDERIAVEMMKLGAMDYLVKDAQFLNVFPEKLKKTFDVLDTKIKLQQSEEALVASEERSKKILDSMNDPVYICSMDHKVQYANPAMEKYIGDGFFENKCYASLFGRSEPCVGCKELTSPTAMYTNTEVLVPSDSSKYQVSSGPINFKNGTISRLHILRDMTDLIEAKNKAKENEAKAIEQHNLLRTLIDNIPDKIYVKDKDSKFVLNNSAHQEEHGHASQESLLGKSDFDFFDEDMASEFYKDEEKIIKSGVPLINKEEFASFPDGTFIWNLVTKVPIKDEEGNISGIAGINRNITERKEMEEELFRSRYELSVRNKIAGIFLTSQKDQIFNRVLDVILDQLSSEFGFFGYLNEKGELICPAISKEVFKKSSIQGKDIVFPPEIWAGTWGRSLMEKKPVLSNEELMLSDGHIRLKNTLSVPILMNDVLIGQITVADKLGGYKKPDQDLLETICEYIAPILSAFLNEEKMLHEKEKAYDDLKLAKEKAEESDKLKSAFLLNLSHELRTPMNAIMGFTRLISQKYSHDESTAGYMDQIDMAGKDLMKMVDDTIDMAKLENKQVKVCNAGKDISHTLKEIASGYKALYDDSFPGIDFILKDTTKDLILNTDHDQLKKVIFKILDNAVKFTESGKVELNCYLNGNKKVVITIKDSGIGIEEQYHKAVFEKFRRVAEGEKVLYRGNGLGLSISKGIMEILGGSIQIDSKPGKGTTVYLSLPANT